MRAERLLRLEAIRVEGKQLFILANLAGHTFSTSVWYGAVNLTALSAQLGREAFERLSFHVAAFELNKLCSLMPTTLSFGPYARFVTPQFWQLWSTVLHNVWAQWRFEHDLPSWSGPKLVDALVTRAPNDRPARGQAREHASSEDVLLFFGGGKDSLVAAKLLERAKIPYSTLTYAHSSYGSAAPQMALVDRLIDELSPVRRYKQWVADDAFAAPITELVEGTASHKLLAAETPSSIFGALPLVLAHGHRFMALAHEFSANRGNLIWQRTGEEVNHQWGKSWAAEAALSTYIQAELVPGFHWFSILQPLSDVLIFELLRDCGPGVLATHSCNVRKPWCHRCAKCAYVALSYAAHLPDGVYESVFTEDVLDLPENENYFRQLMGLSEHTPFECIGEIGEARLALALCASRARRGRAVELFQRELGRVSVEPLLERYGRVHSDAPHGIPPPIWAAVAPLMRDAESRASARIRALLGAAT